MISTRITSIVSPALAVILLLADVSPIHAQCRDWVPGPLDNFPQGITDGTVNAMITWDHDGFPSTPSWLIVAGEFNSAGGVAAKNIAGWDGHVWHALGTGINNNTNTASVRSLCVYNGQLIAGGIFTQAGSATMTNNIARWDNSSWQPCGTGNPGSSYTAPVYALAVYNNTLMAAGTNNGSSTNCITVRTWDGANWLAAGNGLDGIIYAMCIWNGQLYAGGTFTTLGGVNADHVARWNGSSWQSLSPNFSNALVINSLAVNPWTNKLVAGGSWISFGTVASPNIATYNGTFWEAMGTGLGVGNIDGTNGVRALIGTNDQSRQIVAVGSFGAAPNVKSVAAAWNGTAWQTLSDQFNDITVSAQVYDPSVINGGDEAIVVGGRFTAIGGLGRDRVTQFQAYTNASFPLANAAPVRAMVNGGLFTGGDFVYPIPGGATAHYIMRWNGSTTGVVKEFPNAGEGTNAPVYALLNISAGPINYNLYAGGYFTTAGGHAANRIARYSYSDQAVLASWNAMGNGFNDAVWAIESHAGSIYAAGAFTQGGAGGALNHVARWDGTTWQPVGQGLSGLVYALKSFNGELYAAGSFIFTGQGASAARFAHWNGTTWSGVGIGMNDGVYALAVDNGTLVLGGGFTQADVVSAKGVVRWNGISFSAIGTGLDGIVNSLASSAGRLAAGGSFSFGNVVHHVAEFSGSWYFPDTSSEPNDRVYALSLRGGELQAGGDLSSLGSGEASYSWARLLDYQQPTVTQYPADAVVPCGGNTSFTYSLEATYAPHYTFQWRRNLVNLSNGTTAGGTIISGATTPTLFINHAAAQDAGSYTCVIFPSPCLPVSSPAATLTVSNCCTPDVAPPGGNGAVNTDDLLAVVNGWGACPAPPAGCPTDIAPPGGNGFTNVDDLLGVINGWGPCPP